MIVDRRVIYRKICATIMGAGKRPELLRFGIAQRDD